MKYKKKLYSNMAEVQTSEDDENLASLNLRP
jgi:hypothetical protein